jgi:hypothetical protein
VWLAYDYQTAVCEAKEAGLSWNSEDPISLIRKDWRAALRKETWSPSERFLATGRVTDLGSYRVLIHRLRPTQMLVFGHENVDALKGLTSLQELYLYNCQKLRSMEALQTLSGLQKLYIDYCPELQNIDALKNLADLGDLELDFHIVLQRLDTIKALTRLKKLTLCVLAQPGVEDVSNSYIGLREYIGKIRTGTLSPFKTLNIESLQELCDALPDTDIQLHYIGPFMHPFGS